MSVRIGTADPARFYVGTQPVKRLFVGSTLIWQPPFAGTSNQYTTPGTYLYAVDELSRYIDLVGIGGGGSGGGGDGGWSWPVSEGGKRGIWNAIRLERGVDISWLVTQIQLDVGPGGPQVGKETQGNPGTATVFRTPSGAVLLNCSAGAGGRPAKNASGPNVAAEAAGNTTFNGIPYTGGGATPNDTDGYAPGSGGGAATGGGFGSGKPGRKGGDGAGFFRAYQ